MIRDNRVIGRCSECGGTVSLPTVWHSVNRPTPKCEGCGATADPRYYLPTIPMLPKSKDFQITDLREYIKNYRPNHIQRLQTNVPRVVAAMENAAYQYDGCF